MKRKPFQLSEADIQTLRTAQDSFGNANIRASVRDLFALGLFLRMLGHTPEGYKACSHALRTLGIGAPLSARILKHLDGNEEYLAITFRGHSEFLDLVQRQSQRKPMKPATPNN